MIKCKCQKSSLILILCFAFLNVIIVVFHTYQKVSPNTPLRFKQSGVLEDLNLTLTLLHKELNAMNKTVNVFQSAKDDLVVQERHISEQKKKLLNFNVNAPIQITANEKITRKAVIFTMDSISTYEKNSLRGGAAGELTIRRSLEAAFQHLGVDVKVIRSDNEFDKFDLSSFHIIILDPWTWAAKGWVPKRNILSHESRVFILDFFGSKKMKGNKFNIPQHRILTAFGSPWNTFLGYYIPEHAQEEFKQVQKSQQGVIWGKDVKHFSKKEKMLQSVADLVPLFSTASAKAFKHSNVHWLGHQSAQGWKQLLAKSKFLIGLGNPILGPSAIDALSVGCVYINPIFDKPQLDGVVRSQHPFAADIGLPYVCSYQQSNIEQLINCTKIALKSSNPPYIPASLKWDSYIERVKKIFSL